METEPEPSGPSAVSLAECGGLLFPGQPYSACVLKVGYCCPQPDGTAKADGTITLLTGPQNILVDTGGPWDRDFLLRSLQERGLSAADIHVVVGTHGHSDHIGNLGLFPTRCWRWALTCAGGHVRGQPVSAGGSVLIVPTPGHSGQDVSVQVTGLAGGTTLLVAGDLFESCKDEATWRELSLNPAQQQLNRQRALQAADVIIPGHGLPFRVCRETIETNGAGPIFPVSLPKNKL
uniref:Metallo-beta-lactamase domain-containing protein 1 n=1 Tax=Neogobius melanostomus TaxID=47308 RepID=A0A8C6UMN8_9GOBI